MKLEAARTPAAPVKGLPARPTPPAAGKARPRLGRTEAVVLVALLLVAENVIGALNLLEPGLGLLVTRVAVGVILPRQLAVGFLDVLVGGIAFYAKDVVVVRHGPIVEIRSKVFRLMSHCSAGRGTMVGCSSVMADLDEETIARLRRRLTTADGQVLEGTGVG